MYNEAIIILISQAMAFVSLLIAVYALYLQIKGNEQINKIQKQIAKTQQQIKLIDEQLIELREITDRLIELRDNLREIYDELMHGMYERNQD